MQISKEDIAEIKKFNRNIDWLKRTHSIAPAQVSPRKADEWLSVPETIQFINRSRSWLQRVTVISPAEALNPSMMLIKGLDWKRETNRIYYKRSSLENLKKGMEKAGEIYDNRLTRNEASAV